MHPPVETRHSGVAVTRPVRASGRNHRRASAGSHTGHHGGTPAFGFWSPWVAVSRRTRSTRLLLKKTPIRLHAGCSWVPSTQTMELHHHSVLWRPVSRGCDEHNHSLSGGCSHRSRLGPMRLLALPVAWRKISRPKFVAVSAANLCPNRPSVKPCRTAFRARHNRRRTLRAP